MQSDPSAEEERGRPGRARLLVACAAFAALALLAAAWLALRDTGPLPPVPPPAAWRANEASSAADYVMRPAELVRIAQVSLPSERPLLLELELAEASTHAGPLVAQLRDTSGRELDLLAAVEGSERRQARVQIETGWLHPGSYLVELRTTERSHFPIRRYPFEVR